MTGKNRNRDSTEQALWIFVMHQAILAFAKPSHRSLTHIVSSIRKKKG
jgi:hypothetical protein